MAMTEVSKVTMKPPAERSYTKELARLKQAISDHDQAHQYNGRLVAELLAHMGLIHKTPESMRRWGR